MLRAQTLTARGAVVLSGSRVPTANARRSVRRARPAARPSRALKVRPTRCHAAVVVTRFLLELLQALLVRCLVDSIIASRWTARVHVEGQHWSRSCLSCVVINWSASHTRCRCPNHLRHAAALPPGLSLLCVWGLVISTAVEGGSCSVHAALWTPWRLTELPRGLL
jgi:hypothetical protein